MALSTMPTATTTPPPAEPNPWQDEPLDPPKEPKHDSEPKHPEPKPTPDPWQD